MALFCTSVDADLHHVSQPTNRSAWSVRLVALNLRTSPEMVHRHYGHDHTKSRAPEFADVWLSKEEE